MKYARLVLCAAVICVSAAMLFNGCSRKADADIVPVERILDHPDAYVDKEVQTRGVVCSVLPEKHLISVISEEEYKECGIDECNANEQLPVRYEGMPPDTGKAVLIAGNVRRNGKGFIYEARSIQNIEHLPAGK